MKNAIVQSLLSQATSELTNDAARLDELISEYSGTDVGAFINKALEWYMDTERSEDGDKHQLFWEMFHKAFIIDPINFLGCFQSFVINSLLDDSGFRIEWRKPEYDENHMLIWDGAEVRTILSSKDDLDAEPEVVIDYDGKQDPLLLIEAMDAKLAYRARRIKKIRKVEAMFKKLRDDKS